MKGFGIVSKGTEDVAALEVKEILKAKASVREGAVVFPIKKPEDLCHLAYRSQSFSRILLHLDEFESGKGPKEALSKFKGDLKIVKKLMKRKEVTFAARAIRHGEQDFATKDIERELGETIHREYPSVDLNDPDIVFFAYVVGKRYLIGIDFTGDIGKREYRIYTTPKELKAGIAYSLLRIGGYDGKKSVLDPFAGSGTIGIEAALFAAGKSHKFFKKDGFLFSKFDLKFDPGKIDSKMKKKVTGINSTDALLHNSKISEKNAKIAGVEKDIRFSKIDIEWLDTKFDERSLDLVVSYPITPSKITDEKDVRKTYNELFYQLEFVMKKKGKVVLISKNNGPEMLKEAAERNKFKVKAERDISQGEDVLKVIVFER